MLKTTADTVRMEIEQNGTKIECELRKMPNLTPETRLIGEICAEIITSAEILREMVQFQDQDPNSLIGISIVKDTALILTSDKYGVSAQIKIPKESNLIERFTAERDVKFSYQAEFIKPVMKCVNRAKKVSMRFDSNGFFSVQVLVYSQQNHDDSFIEYFIVPSS